MVHASRENVLLWPSLGGCGQDQIASDHKANRFLNAVAVAQKLADTCVHIGFPKLRLDFERGNAGRGDNPY